MKRSLLPRGTTFRGFCSKAKVQGTSGDKLTYNPGDFSSFLLGFPYIYSYIYNGLEIYINGVSGIRLLFRLNALEQERLRGSGIPVKQPCIEADTVESTAPMWNCGAEVTAR